VEFVDKGEIGSLVEVGELCRVPADKRRAFVAKLKLGQLKGKAAMRKYGDELIG
jgi:hypothetical protein